MDIDGRKKDEKMRKIKGLKIPIRYYDIERKIKKKSIDLSSVFGKDDTDTNLKNFISLSASWLKIMLIYDTFDLSKDDILKGLINNKRITYASFCFLTLGSYIDEKKKSIDEAEVEIFDILIDVVCHTSFEALKDIIDEEAKKEKFTAGDITFIYQPSKEITSSVVHIYNLLNLSSEGIEIRDNFIFPINSWFIAVPWVPSKR